VATISRAIKNPELLNAKTLKHVRSVISDLSYVPNVQARNLRTLRTGLVLVMVPDISRSIFSQVIRGVEKVAHANQYGVLLGDTQNDLSREETYYNFLSSRQVDGLITLIPRVPKLDLAEGWPIVNVGSYVDDDTVTRVHVDNVKAAREATAVLIAMGHSCIGHLSGDPKSPVFHDRETGYRAALAEAGIEIPDSWVVPATPTVEDGEMAAELLLTRNPDITAIVCSSDEMSVGAIRGVRKLGKQVPADVSIIGFGDTPMCRYSEPPMTTVAQPFGQMGEEAMRLLLEMLAAPGSTPPRRRILETQLVMRGSTARNRRT